MTAGTLHKRNPSTDKRRYQKIVRDRVIAYGPSPAYRPPVPATNEFLSAGINCLQRGSHRWRPSFSILFYPPQSVAKKILMISRFEPGTSPALLLLHGTGGDENDLLPLGQLLRPGAALLSPRGQILEHGQPRFFRRLAPGVFDQDDLMRRTHELADFVEDQSASRHLGPVIAVGYSNGANIAAAMLLLRPDVLAGAILFRAMLPLEPPHPPQLPGTPVLLLAGRHDNMIPQDSTQHLAVLLEQIGAQVTLDWLDAGHGLGSADIKKANEWIKRSFAV